MTKRNEWTPGWTEAEITQVEHLVLHPWEALLVHVAGRRWQSDIDGIKESVKAVLPKGAKVIVVTEGITFEVVTAPESAGEGGRATNESERN